MPISNSPPPNAFKSPVWGIIFFQSEYIIFFFKPSDLSVFIQQAQSSLKFISSHESTALPLSALISKQSRDPRDQVLSASLHLIVEKTEVPASPWLSWGRQKKHSDRSGTRTHGKSGFRSHTGLGSRPRFHLLAVCLWTGSWTFQKPSVIGRTKTNLIGGLWELNELIYLKTLSMVPDTM